MIGFPIFYLLITAYLFALRKTGVLSISLSPLFYIASLFWISTGAGLFRTQKWSWYTLAISQVLLTYLNALVLLNYSDSPAKGLAFVFTLIVQVIIFYQVKRDIRVPYLFPNIRWWESGLAGTPHINVQVVTDQSMDLGQILDMSLRGCFLKTQKSFNHFEKVKLVGRPFAQDIELNGVVVWTAKSSVTHPKGVGIKFYGLNRVEKKRLRNIVHLFKAEQKKTGLTHVP